jgi:hypothetical protein
MNAIAKTVALLALALTIGPPTWIFLAGIARGTQPTPTEVVEEDAGEANVPAKSEGFMSERLMKGSMAVGAVLWFLAAPKWLKDDR